MIVTKAYGIGNSSIHNLSVRMVELGVHHMLLSRGAFSKTGNYSNLPAIPVLVDGIGNLKYIELCLDRIKKPIILYVVDSYIALMQVNVEYPSTPEKLLKKLDVEDIKTSLIIGGKAKTNWRLQRSNQNVLKDTIKRMSKHTLLDVMQTALYKIHNYPLRKEALANLLGYLNGDIAENTLVRFAKGNEKTLFMVEMPKTLEKLRTSVLHVRKTNMPENKVPYYAKTVGLESFEILYCIKSYNNAQKVVVKKAAK